MPEYHRVKGDMPSLEFFKHPEKAARATLDAQRILGVDAAIMFADLVQFELGAIAYQCWKLYSRMGADGYASYVPTGMQWRTGQRRLRR